MPTSRAMMMITTGWIKPVRCRIFFASSFS